MIFHILTFHICIHYNIRSIGYPMAEKIYSARKANVAGYKKGVSKITSFIKLLTQRSGQVIAMV